MGRGISKHTGYGERAQGVDAAMRVFNEKTKNLLAVPATLWCAKDPETGKPFVGLHPEMTGAMQAVQIDASVFGDIMTQFFKGVAERALEDRGAALLLEEALDGRIRRAVRDATTAFTEEALAAQISRIVTERASQQVAAMYDVKVSVELVRRDGDSAPGVKP